MRPLPTNIKLCPCSLQQVASSNTRQKVGSSNTGSASLGKQLLCSLLEHLAGEIVYLQTLAYLIGPVATRHWEAEDETFGYTIRSIRSHSHGHIDALQ